MAKKYYVVWKGRKTGVFNNWTKVKDSVDKFSGALYKSFKSYEEAKSAFNDKKNLETKTKPSLSSLKRVKYSPDVFNQYAAVIFCDGACNPNPGESGSGVALYRHGGLRELWHGLYNPRGTNNTAELNALFQALLIAKKEASKGVSVAIFSDSMYSVRCLDEWAPGWEKKGWKKKGDSIKNLEIIKKSYFLYNEIKDRVHLSHVSAHIDIEGNELADRMSLVAVSEKKADFNLYTKTYDIETILKIGGDRSKSCSFDAGF